VNDTNAAAPARHLGGGPTAPGSAPGPTSETTRTDGHPAPHLETGDGSAALPWRRLLVHLDGSPRSAERLALARRLAGQAGATLLAMHAVTPVWAEMPMSALGDAGAGVLLQEAEAERRRGARSLYDREAMRPGAPMRWHDATELGDSGWGTATTAFGGRALCSDLVVLGQRDPEDALAWGVPADFVPTVVADSGCPVLVVPRVGHYPAIGQRVLVAWKPAREAARALATALPLLKRARHVEVAHWRESGEAHTALPADEPHTTPAALEDWLQAHGVRARHTQQGDAHADIGEQLLSLAAHVDADLLVMGCYGRSRTREWLLGGATRTVLQNMTVPVWMAH
jgi:nucleotide-binding universal stress UspA family protein